MRCAGCEQSGWRSCHKDWPRRQVQMRGTGGKPDAGNHTKKCFWKLRQEGGKSRQLAGKWKGRRTGVEYIGRMYNYTRIRYVGPIEEETYAAYLERRQPD